MKLQMTRDVLAITFNGGRYSDGHEKFENGKISNMVINSLRVNHPQPILNFNQSGNWTFKDTTNAWKGLESINNPYPIGFVTLIKFLLEK